MSRFQEQKSQADGNWQRRGRPAGVPTAEADPVEPVLNQLRTLGIGYAQGRAVALPEPLADSEGEVTLPVPGN